MIFPDSGAWVLKLVAVVSCVLFGIINLVSVKGSGRFQSVMVLGLIGILAAFIIAASSSVQAVRFQPFATHGWQSMFAVAGMVFVSYGGLTKVASISEEIRNPGVNIPLGMFIAYFTINALYILVVSVSVGVLPAEKLAGSLTPIASAAVEVMGPIGLVVHVAAFLAFVTTANAGVLSAARSPVAMSRDGLFLEQFARTSKRFGTPYVSITFTCLFMIVCLVFLSIEDLVKTASAIMIIMFILVNFSMVIMRQSGLQNYRPTFRSPLYPWLQIGGITGLCFSAVQDGHGAFAADRHVHACHLPLVSGVCAQTHRARIGICLPGQEHRLKATGRPRARR